MLCKRKSKIIFAFVFFISTFISSVFAAPEVVLVSGSGTERIFRTRGAFTPSELRKIYNQGSYPGLNVFYQADTDTKLSFMASSDENFVCSTDATTATQEINKFISQNVLIYGTKNIGALSAQYFRVMCRTVRMVTGGNVDNNVYVYERWVGPPVDPNSPYCTTDVPLNVSFETVQLGLNPILDVKVNTKCDKDADVKISLSGGTNGVLDLTGTKIGYSLDDSKSTTKTYIVKANIVKTASIKLAVIDTGKSAGMKTGFILIRTEVQ